jgi:hypothetical protein
MVYSASAETSSLVRDYHQSLLAPCTRYPGRRLWQEMTREIVAYTLENESQDCYEMIS